MSVDRFARKRPCGSCPFRCEAPKNPELPGEGLFVGLSPARVGEIAASVREGAMFPCHKSVDYSLQDDPDYDEFEDEGGRTVGAGEHWCAGALVTLVRSEEVFTPALIQIAQRLGVLDLTEFHVDTAPVYGSLDEWVAAMTDRYERLGR